MSREEDKRSYSNGEITVYWKPSECIHSTICYKNLLEVFNPSKRPWINMQGSTTEKIIDIVKRCPTSALTYKNNNGSKSEKAPRNDELKTSQETPAKDNPVIIEVVEGGPLMVEGNFIVVGAEEKKFGKTGMAYFCRCGNSKNMPYCDGTHRKIEFNK